MVENFPNLGRKTDIQIQEAKTVPKRINLMRSIQRHILGEESRWWRNRTGRSLSLLQIHRKNNRTVNKVYKTTSDR